MKRIETDDRHIWTPQVSKEREEEKLDWKDEDEEERFYVYLPSS